MPMRFVLVLLALVLVACGGGESFPLALPVEPSFAFDGGEDGETRVADLEGVGVGEVVGWFTERHGDPDEGGVLEPGEDVGTRGIWHGGGAWWYGVEGGELFVAETADGVRVQFTPGGG